MRKKKLYVVGYDTDHNCIYGENNANGSSRWADPMTLREAKKSLVKEMLDTKAHPVIYKLVPVDPKELS